MADNQAQYGIRWAAGYAGQNNFPTVEERTVPSGASFDETQTNLYLGKGDLVKLETNGGVTLWLNADTAAGPYGVVMGVLPYWDGTVMKPTRLLPSDIVYGTNLQRQSKVLVAPLAQGVWEADVDDQNNTTEAAYQTLVNMNVTVLNSTTNTTRPAARIDISTAASTSTLNFRLVGISKTQLNQDFSGANVKMLIVGNVIQQAMDGQAGVA